MRARRALALLGVVWLLVADAGDEAAGAEPVELAVRRDAAPFSYFDAGAGRYAGFMVDLCTQVVREMGREPVYVEVSARSRFDPETDYDVLCDPTTVTPERAAVGVFSPVVFVSGISFAFSAANNDALYQAARAQKTDGTAGRAAAAKGDGLPACAELDGRNRAVATRIGVLAGTTAVPVVARLLASPDAAVTGLSGDACLFEVASHGEGFDRLCGATDAPPLSHYFADRDILSDQIRRRRASGDDCGLTLSRRFFSVEPYALTVREPDIAFVRAFMGAFYRVYRAGGAEGPRALFERYFAGRRPSDMVETIFFLNAAGDETR